MRLVKWIGLLLAAVCALSAIVVSDASASPTFLSHPAGALLLATADNFQNFHTPGGALTVQCGKLKLLPPDTAPSLQALSILVTVDYENCEVLTVATALVHPVRYLIDANGLVTLENTVLILAGEACRITIPAAKNQSLKTVKFDNQANGSILLLSKVTGITSSGSGLLCAYAEESNGTYEGNARVIVEGGVVRWDP
jgi:hypothetical protein